MFLKTKILAVVIVACVTCILPMASVLAEDAASERSRQSSPPLILQPASEITLMTGESVKLSVFDTRMQQVVNGGKVEWSANGMPIDALDPSLGTLSLSSNKKERSTIVYRAPAKVSARRDITVVASVAKPGGRVEAKCDICVSGEANWFSVDGDTKMGRRDVIFQLDPKIRFEAGFGALPFDIRKQYFDVHVEGTEKGSPQTSVILDLNLSPGGKPGTYIWHGTKPVIGAIIVFPGRLSYSSLSVGSDPRLGGSTTIMERDSNDPAGLVKGFYNGRVKWTEGVGRSAKDHYVTIRGHFAVPAVGAATKP